MFFEGQHFESVRIPFPSLVRSKKQRDMKDKSQFNPTRLFISGLAQGAELQRVI